MWTSFLLVLFVMDIADWDAHRMCVLSQGWKLEGCGKGSLNWAGWSIACETGLHLRTEVNSGGL